MDMDRGREAELDNYFINTNVFRAPSLAGFMLSNVTKNVAWICRSTSSFVLKGWRRAGVRDWTRC